MITRKSILITLAIFALTGLTCPAVAQQGPPAVITFDFDFPNNTPPHYTLRIAEDGAGSYTAPAQNDPNATTTFHLVAEDVAPWFARARALNCFQGNFASTRKVAFTGTKALSMQSGKCSGQTTFSFTQDPQLTAIVTDLQQLAATLQTGQTLQQDLRFHRMALDQDMESLQQALAGHVASHPEAIAPALEQVCDDPQVVEKARRSARAMLSSKYVH